MPVMVTVRSSTTLGTLEGESDDCKPVDNESAVSSCAETGVRNCCEPRSSNNAGDSAVCRRRRVRPCGSTGTTTRCCSYPAQATLAAIQRRHSGACSSHLTWRALQVRHPVRALRFLSCMIGRSRVPAKNSRIASLLSYDRGRERVTGA